ncbi:TPA: hypothetical protein ACX6RU_000739 [Photobacterium damselae]
MGTVTDYRDDAIAIKSGLNIIFRWAKANRWRRIFIYIIIALVVIFGYNYLITSKLEEASKQEELYVKKIQLDSHKDILYTAINIVNNCIDARDKHLPLEKWYCDFATTKYNDFKKHSILDKEAKKLIETSNAYELMIIDLKGQLQHIDYKYLILNKPKNPAMDTLNILISYIFIIPLIVISNGILLFLFWYLNRPEKQAIENEP